MQLAMQLSKLIFPGFVMLLAFLVWELNSKGLSYDTLGTWGLSMCSIVAIIIVKEIIARKRIRKEFLRKNHSIKDVIRNSRELLETNDDYYHQYKEASFPPLLQNTTIYMFLIFLCVSLMFVAGQFCFSSWEKASSQKEFMIYTDQNKHYAIIYVTGNKYIMEEADIYENSITIHTNSQRIISDINLSYEKILFNDTIID